MINEAQVLAMANQFDECKIEDRGFSIGITLKGYSRVKYGVSFTIEKKKLDTMLEAKCNKANNSVINMLGDKVSTEAREEWVNNFQIPEIPKNSDRVNDYSLWYPKDGTFVEHN